MSFHFILCLVFISRTFHCLSLSDDREFPRNATILVVGSFTASSDAVEFTDYEPVEVSLSEIALFSSITIDFLLVMRDADQLIGAELRARRLFGAQLGELFVWSPFRDSWRADLERRHRSVGYRAVLTRTDEPTDLRLTHQLATLFGLPTQFGITATPHLFTKLDMFEKIYTKAGLERRGIFSLSGDCRVPPHLQTPAFVKFNLGVCATGRHLF
jgi:hypothetical protein